MLRSLCLPSIDFRGRSPYATIAPSPEAAARTAHFISCQDAIVEVESRTTYEWTPILAMRHQLATIIYDPLLDVAPAGSLFAQSSPQGPPFHFLCDGGHVPVERALLSQCFLIHLTQARHGRFAYDIRRSSLEIGYTSIPPSIRRPCQQPVVGPRRNLIVRHRPEKLCPEPACVSPGVQQFKVVFEDEYGVQVFLHCLLQRHDVRASTTLCWGIVTESRVYC